MTKYIHHAIDEDGWTRWFFPSTQYRESCCDCGLVHDIEFRLHFNKDTQELFIEKRVRRNERATSAVRRYRR